MNPGKQEQGIQVIGCGLPRSGTASLQAALHILGYKPCHHMHTDVLPDPYGRGQRWIEAWDAPDKATRQALIHDMFTSGSYRATVDFPPSLFVDDLIEMYPDAKVVLGLRSSPQAWRRSFDNTLGTRWFKWCRFLLPSNRWCDLPLESRWETLNRHRYHAQIYRTTSTAVYTRHNDWVRRVVPKRRLLELQPGQGWGPLCEFLGLPVPDEPYPHVNDTKDYRRRFYVGAPLGLCLWALLAAVCVALLAAANVLLARSANGGRFQDLRWPAVLRWLIWSSRAPSDTMGV